jgi:hypothetical protein
VSGGVVGIWRTDYSLLFLAFVLPLLSFFFREGDTGDESSERMKKGRERGEEEGCLCRCQTLAPVGLLAALHRRERTKARSREGGRGKREVSKEPLFHFIPSLFSSFFQLELFAL